MKAEVDEFQLFRCPLNKYTFKIKDIRKWVESNCVGRVLNLFAGYTKLDVDEIRVDLDENAPADYHMDAIDFLLMAKETGERFNTVVLDPPYASRKSMEMYGGRKMSCFLRVKDLLLPILTPVAKVITLGYHSNSMGKVRGFETSKIALFSHGGAIHDTIGVVEIRRLE